MKTLLVILSLLSSAAYGQIAGFMLTASAAGGGGGSRASHWAADTIKPSSITGGSNLDSFTVTVNFSQTYFKSAANGGDIQNVVGGNPTDLLFCADNACATKYKFDIETYSPTAGTGTAHVLLPTVSASVNTIFYMVWDSALLSTYQGGNNPYDSKTKAAYYFNETLSGSSGQTIHDYTANGLNMTSHGSWTSGQQAAGQVGGSLSFSKSSSDYLTMTAQNYTSDYTVEGWYRSPGTPDLTDNWWLNSDNETTLMGVNTTFELFNGCGNAGNTTAFNANTWYYIVFTRSGTASQAYTNGVLDDTQATGCNVTFEALGAGSSGTDISQDNISDDIRISTVLRTGGWIKAKYDNQKTSSTFVIQGARN